MTRTDYAGTTTSGSAATSNYALCWLLVMACGITFRLEQPTTLAMRSCLTILQHEPGHRIPGAKSYRSVLFDSPRLLSISSKLSATLFNSDWLSDDAMMAQLRSTSTTTVSVWLFEGIDVFGIDPGTCYAMVLW
jgi:hypothetical protein